MSAAPEFSRIIAIEGIIPDKTRKEQVEATPDECAALCQRFDLRGLSGLKAQLNIRRVPGGTAVRVDGELEADVVQTCVVSLRDVESHIKAQFDTCFTEDAPEIEEMELSHDTVASEDNTPDMILNGMIDLGEVVAQHLALELDPYPRAPGVSLAAQMAESGAEVKNRPFQILEALKSKVSGKSKKKTEE